MSLFSMKSNKLGLAVICVLFSGCGTVGEDSSQSFAWGEVDRVGRAISRITYEQAKGIETLDGALDIAAKQGRISPESRNQFRKDFWGNPYIFQRLVEEDRVIFRVISKGENGMLENGGGDDITSEVVIPKAGGTTRTVTFKGKRVARE
jgi:hypothetical protein